MYFLHYLDVYLDIIQACHFVVFIHLRCYLASLLCTLCGTFISKKIGTLLIVTYAIGFLFSLGNPLQKVFNWFDDIKMSMMLRKARQNAEHQFHSYQSDNSDDTRQQAEDCNRQHQQAEEELRRAKEQFQRERMILKSPNKNPNGVLA